MLLDIFSDEHGADDSENNTLHVRAIIRTFNTYLDIQQIFDSPEKTMILLSYKISWILLPDFRILSHPRVRTPQALSDLPDDQASMGVPAHEEEISPMGYCRVSYR